MELTPRTSEADATPRGRRRVGRRWLPLGVIAVVLVALGVLVTKGLSDSTMYFRNVDEAIAQRDTLSDKRFRLQGTVVGEPVQTGGMVEFEVSYNGAVLPVRHVGDPPELFQPGIPVVLEGHFSDASSQFASDRIMVKHDENYVAKDDYDERVDDAEEGGEAP